MKTSSKSTTSDHKRKNTIIILLGLLLVFVAFGLRQDSSQPAEPRATTQISTSTVVPTPTLTPTTLSDLEKQALYNLTIQINEMDIYKDGYFIKGSIVQDGVKNGELESSDVSQAMLFDSEGKQIHYVPVYFFSDYQHNTITFNYYVKSEKVPDELTLLIPSMKFIIQDSKLWFSIPRVPYGNTNIDIKKNFYYKGHRIYVDSVNISESSEMSECCGPYYSTKFNFKINPDPNIQSLSVEAFGFNFSGFSDDSYFHDKYLIAPYMLYQGMKSGITITFKINNIVFTENANWKKTWRPKDSLVKQSIETTELSNACITETNWKTLLANRKDSWPSTISGKLLLKNPAKSQVSILNLQEQRSQEIKLINSEMESVGLSPNGEYLVYLESDSNIFHLIDLTTQETKSISVPEGTYGSFVFSKDSSSVAMNTDHYIFQLTLPELKLTKLMGFERSPVIISDWFKDEKIMYVIWYYPKASGEELRSYNIETGEIKTLKNLQVSSASPKLSSDKKYILYTDFIKDTYSQGLFLSDIAFSSRKLLLLKYKSIEIKSMNWSPDDKWIIMTIGDDYRNTSFVNVLLSPSNCETYNLPISDSIVLGWSN
jgi:hypothetical protein